MKKTSKTRTKPSITKIYRYRLADGRWRAFFALQKKADAIYRKHVSYDVQFVRDLQDPDWIVEIQTYPDLKSAKMCDSLIEREPRLAALFREFISMLHPEDNAIEELRGKVFLLR